jgi:hypothetical protein
VFVLCIQEGCTELNGEGDWGFVLREERREKREEKRGEERRREEKR